MVLHTISWHSIRETAFRLLFLTSSAMMYRDKARQYATGALYISIFALFSTSLLDLPEVKPWTNSFEGVSLTRRSARHKFSAEEREHAPRWARQDVSSTTLLHPLTCFSARSLLDVLVILIRLRLQVTAECHNHLPTFLYHGYSLEQRYLRGFN
jgi:hypothetical protein